MDEAEDRAERLVHIERRIADIEQALALTELFMEQLDASEDRGAAYVSAIRIAHEDQLQSLKRLKKDLLSRQTEHDLGCR